MNRKKLLILVIIFTAIILFLIVFLNPSYKYNNLIVTESKWNNIKETRLENDELVLQDIRFNDYKVIIDEKNNTLYYSLLNDSKNKYNPSVSYDTNKKNVKLAFLSDEITNEKVKGNYQSKIMIYDEKEYHIYNLKCTELPLLNISYNKNVEIKYKNIPMQMYLFDNLSNIPNKITISGGKIKRNEGDYIFSLIMLTPGKNIRNNRISVLNMKPSSEYILVKVSGENGKGIIRNNRVELFFNNEYKGVYSISGFEDNLEKDTQLLNEEVVK